MKILITAATEMELQFINPIATKHVTGVGMVSTVFELLKALQKPYDLVMNIGIAGSFSEKLPIGSTVIVESEVFGDFGVAAPNGFFTCFEEKIIPDNLSPFKNGQLFSVKAAEISELLHLPMVKGITNNTVSGEQSRIDQIKEKFNPGIETMEGAAFFYTCLRENVPFVEIRSISNMVEPRDKSRWNIPLALNNLSDIVNSYVNLLLKNV